MSEGERGVPDEGGAGWHVDTGEEGEGLEEAKTGGGDGDGSSSNQHFLRPGFTDPALYIDLAGISSDQVRRWSDDDNDRLQIPRHPGRRRQHLCFPHQSLEQ
ncbi:hypothetical protein QJS04_geneDACA007148 [Acorus gramineus]|uniref:Uncharacterized protein n=1 Tax=Acorus gramineus TaxID=55184 RepID=A0AAV9BS61_ACOGR|nr:hypothetical protein QJS04_geneDACA007148 [Acorus gramineus]